MSKSCSKSKEIQNVLSKSSFQGQILTFPKVKVMWRTFEILPPCKMYFCIPAFRVKYNPQGHCQGHTICTVKILPPRAISYQRFFENPAFRVIPNVLSKPSSKVKQCPQGNNHVHLKSCLHGQGHTVCAVKAFIQGQGHTVCAVLHPRSNTRVSMVKVIQYVL